MEKKLVSIFEYINYREYLKDLYESLKSTDPKMSYRVLSKQLGMTSPNFIQLVIQGKRNVSQKSIDKIAELARLTNDEKKYFHNLIFMNQAQTMEERLLYQEMLMRSKGYIKIKTLEFKHFEYYSHWALIAIREMCTLHKFKNDPKWISKNIFNDEVTPEEVKKHVGTLKDIGLLKESPDGKLSKTDAHLKLNPGLSFGFIFKFHKMMLEKAIWSLLNLKAKQRDISNVVIPIKKEQIPEISQFIEAAREEFIAKFSNPVEGDAVYSLNLQLFPLGVINDDEDDKK